MPAPTRQDVLNFGLPAPAAVRVPELVESTVDGSGLILKRGHSLGLDAPISFRCISSTTLGAAPSSLGAPLLEGVTYYARPASSDAFQVATAPSPAAPIAAFTSAAVNRFSYVIDLGPALDQAIADAWGIVQSDCTAHGGDTEAPILFSAARALAAQLYLAVVCAGDAAKAESYAGLSAIYDKIYAPKLAAYFEGAPVRGATDATPTIADNAPRARGRRPVGYAARRTL